MAVVEGRRQAVVAVRRWVAVAVVETFRSAPRPAAICALGSVRWEAPEAESDAESGASSDPDVGPPCPAALGVAAAACSPARFCLIESDTSRLSGLPSTTVAIAARQPLRWVAVNERTEPIRGGLMADLLAPALTLLAIAFFIGAWAFYFRRVRQGRADPVVDPSWPSNLRPMARNLRDPANVDPEHSLYFDPGGPELKRRDED